MMNPGQAQSAGLGNFIAQRASVPDDQFVRTVTDFVEKTGVSPIDMLADTYQRVMAAKKAMMRQGLAAGRAEAQQPRTVAEQLNQEALALGIGSQPYVYAGGGLVAFELGGKAEEEPLTLADIEGADLEDAVAQAANVPDAARIARLQEEFYALQRQLIAATSSGDPRAAQYYANKVRDARAVLEPLLVQQQSYLSSQSERPARAATLLAGPPAPAAAAPAAAAPAAAAPAAAASGTAPAGTRSGTRSGAARTPGTDARSGAARTPGTDARSGAGADAGIRPVMPSPAATAADIAEYLKEGQKNIEGMAGRGRVTPAELALREALLKAQEAEREPRVEYKEPEGMTPRELLQLASFDTTKGRWMGSLAEKAAGVMTAREAKAEEFRKLNREIDIANRKLNTALAQQRLAYATSDRQAQEAADLAVANAKLALREKVIDFGLKSRTAVVQEREAGAKEKGAEAEMIKAGAMEKGAGESQKFRRDRELGDAIQEAEQKINNQSMIASPRRAEYLAADAAKKEQMIREERFRYVKERAGAFATEAEIRQRMNVAPAGAAPAAGATDPLGIRK